MANFDGTFAPNGPQHPEAWVIAQQKLVTDQNGDVTVGAEPVRRYNRSFRDMRSAALTLRRLVNDFDGHCHIVPLEKAAGDDDYYFPLVILRYPDGSHDSEAAYPVAAVLIYQQGHTYTDIIERIDQRAADEDAIQKLEEQFTSNN